MKNKLTYFITRSSMFGIGFFHILRYSKKDSWIAVLLGTLIGVIVLYVYKHIKEFFRNINIKDILGKTLIGKFYLIIFLIFYIFLIIIILITLPLFVNSFYLVYTPKALIVIPFLLLAIYISTKEKRVIESLSSLLFFFSIIIILVYGLLLTKYVEINNILPIYSEKSLSIIKSALIFASMTSIPQIISINYNYTSFKDDLREYLIGAALTFMMILLIILCFGSPLISIYSFPEYAVLKQIKILDFIENIENLSTFVWYFDLFMTLSALTINIKETLPKKYNRIYFYLLMILVIYLSVNVIGHNYRIIITIYYMYPIILGIFFSIFVTLLIYIKNSKKIKEYKKSLQQLK